MDSFTQYHDAARQQPPPFDPQIHEQRQFDNYNNGETLSEYSVDTSDASAQAAKQESQAFFPSVHAPNFSPYSMVSVPSPYSSASSSSFESPPAEPFKMIDSDYTSAVVKPDDLSYNYIGYDQADQYGYHCGNVTNIPTTTQPAVYTEIYSQEFAVAPIASPMMCTSAATKSQPQHYQQWEQPQQSPQQTQSNNYPSFSTQGGRMRSMSDGAPLGPISRTGGVFNSLYAQQSYSGQVKYAGCVPPLDSNVRPTNIPDEHTGRPSFLPPFARLRSLSHTQEPALQRSTPQAEYFRRERERSMSDAALPRMRSLAYTSSPYPSIYRPFDQKVHTTNAHSATMHSTNTDIQSYTGYHQQQQLAPQPIYKFSQVASDYSHTRVDSESIHNQDSRSSDELSPVLGIRQLEIQSRYDGCEPHYSNDNIKGGGGDAISYNGYARENIKTAIKKEEEEESVTSEDLQRSKIVLPHLLDVEDGDEDAEGEDDDADVDYEAGEYDPEDDDGEFVVPKRRNSVPGSTRSLRTRPSTKARSCRFEPYSYSSSSRPASKPNSSSRAITSRQRTRTRTRHTNSLPVPVPVPNLTKKSRGRRVPTIESLIPSSVGKSIKVTSRREGDDKNARTYTCDAVGCGKCFARGEHLKRHVRSIHTYEKPHKCPFPGCDKDFSRHDNLRQHLRVHKDYVPKTDFQDDSEETW